MEVNCLVFPSPQKFNIQPIINKVVLIPQNIETQSHISYQNYLHLSAHVQDEFQKTIKRLNSEYMMKTRDQTKVNTKESNTPQFHQHFGKEEVHKLMNKDDKLNKQNTFTTKDSQKQSLFVQSTYNIRQSKHSPLEGNLEDHKVPSSEFIACLFLPGKKDKIIVFFHANAQDITSSSQFLKMINLETQYSILAMQYRGYSISKGQTNPQKIKNDAQKVINYLMKRNISSEQIIIFGRSIGCAIALGLVCAQYQFYAMVLLSPFLSLKKIAQQLYGNCAGWALKQGFDNQKNTLNISCPLLLIHGMKDTLVPYEHSLALFSHCRSYCQLNLIQTMTHSRFNFRVDFIKHFQSFIQELNQQSSD